MVRKMATPKRKPAQAAKKKSAGRKTKPAKKPAAASARKPQKAAKPIRKPAPVSAAKKKAAKKTAAPKAAAPKPAAKKAVPAKPARKPTKPAAAKPAKPVAAKPAKPAAAKPAKAVSPVPSSKTATASRKVTMASPSSNTAETLSRDDGRYALPSTVVINMPPGYHPTAKEEYMGPRQLAYFRAKLQKWREDLVEESKQTIDNLRDEVRDVGDEAERATRETENSLELRTRDRYRKLIGKIDKALKRIEEGRYGYCEETDEEIGIERLEARPIATLCLDAQERWEHRQKQLGD
jgi:DnaK suppressor protein